MHTNQLAPQIFVCNHEIYLHQSDYRVDSPSLPIEDFGDKTNIMFAVTIILEDDPLFVSVKLNKTLCSYALLVAELPVHLQASVFGACMNIIEPHREVHRLILKGDEAVRLLDQ